MIIDKMENAKLYAGLPGFLMAISELRKLGENPKIGRYDFEDGYFIVQEGDSIPMKEGEYEAHRKYIDVHLLLEGMEEFCWQDIYHLKLAREYLQEGDYAMYSGEDLQRNTVYPGMFWIAFPDDAHKPGRHSQEAYHYKKVVIKLPYQEIAL